MANYVIGLKCVTCGREYSPQQVLYTCPACGPLQGTLDVEYDYRAVAGRMTRKSLQKDRTSGHWRYLPLLPILEPEYIPPLRVGGTPLYRAENLEVEWGVDRIWVKDDGRNPTASYKDRASSVAVVKALEQNARVVTAASTGNAASSWSAFSTLAGLQNIIFVPGHAPEAKLAQLLIYGARVLLVDGNYDQAFDLCCRAAERWGWYNRSTAVNPYLGEGKKTAAFEICEQLNWEVPDYILVPVGDGCILQGVWKGFQEFYRLELIDRLPRLVGVQAEGSAPLVQAWEQGWRSAKPVQPDTIADSIAVGLPRDQVKALRAVRQSRGMFLHVSDGEILAAISALATRTGIFAEPAGAAGLAGLKKLIEQGRCTSSHRVVVLMTGNGLKDIAGVMKATATKPVEVACSLDHVEAKLKRIDD